jgi:hypothetical protein
MRAVAPVVWTVREGKHDKFDGRLLMIGYRFPHPEDEPRLGDVLHLPDGSGPWRVVDWKMTNQVLSLGNVLVVEFAGN